MFRHAFKTYFIDWSASTASVLQQGIYPIAIFVTICKWFWSAEMCFAFFLLVDQKAFCKREVRPAF